MDYLTCTFLNRQTKNKIKDLIPVGAITSMTRLVLTNAIYFKGTWIMEFDKTKTRQENFTTSQGETVKADMMSLTGDDVKFNYAEDGYVQILELPYKGEEVSMLILLPEEGDMGTLEYSLDNEQLQEWKNMLEETEVEVYLPKFEFDTKYFMKEDLSYMGMPTAFSEEADFSGMTGEKDLFISKVIHQAYVKVDEEGTEAAAATAVIMKNESIAAPMKKVFRADRPFIFIIQKKNTGNILFMGRVSDPTR